MAANVG